MSEAGFFAGLGYRKAIKAKDVQLRLANYSQRYV